MAKNRKVHIVFRENKEGWPHQSAFHIHADIWKVHGKAKCKMVYKRGGIKLRPLLRIKLIQWVSIDLRTIMRLNYICMFKCTVREQKGPQAKILFWRKLWKNTFTHTQNMGSHTHTCFCLVCKSLQGFLHCKSDILIP